MYMKRYEESKAQGVAHLEGMMRPHWVEGFDRTIEMLATGKGSRSGCLGGLFDDCNVRAMLAYFRDGNLHEMKHWFYLSSKARIMWVHETLSPISAEDLLWVLASDNEELIAWWRGNRQYYDPPTRPDKKTVVNTDEFARLQSIRALSQDWDALAKDCQRALAQPELFKRGLRPRLGKFQFWLSLATGDQDGMRAYLLELCAPKQRSRYYQFESGLSNNFIASLATLYAKLAWRAGYELELDTPWIPKDWLPVQPLAQYEAPWPFMQGFDIWQPFEEPYAALSPQRPA